MEILTNMPCVFTVHEMVVGSVVRELDRKGVGGGGYW